MLYFGTFCFLMHDQQLFVVTLACSIYQTCRNSSGELETERREKASVAIQNWWRRHLADKLLKEESAVVIQCCFRAFLARKRRKELEEKKAR